MTDDPGRDIPTVDAAGRVRTVSLDSLRLLGEAVNTLRVGADAVAGAGSRFAASAGPLGPATGDPRIVAQYDLTLVATRRVLNSLTDVWQRLAAGLDAVTDAYAEGPGPSEPAVGAP